MRAAEAGAQVPGVAAGWPVVLRGAIIGAPVAADLDGDGKLEVVATAMKRGYDRSLLAPDPTIAVQLWGFRVDGKPFEGWPLTVKSEQQRQAMFDDNGFRPWADNYYASPSVWDVNDDGASEIILNIAGHGATEANGNILVLYADGGRVPLAFGSSDWATMPLADIDGDSVPDLVLDKVLTNVQGGPIRGWPLDKRPASGYQPAVGDADGDGSPEVFLPSSKEEIWGWRANGEPLPGWPRKVSGYSTYVVLGDVAGDEKKEIITVDSSDNLRIWNLDGTPTVPPAAGTAEPEGDGLVATNLSGAAPPCLADLDGDGKAEILVLGGDSRSVHAFRGDGSPFIKREPPANEPWPRMTVRDPKTQQMVALDPKKPADRKRLEAIRDRARGGLLASLPPGNAGYHCGVSVVDLGGDGVMDIFVGTQWIRLAKNGSTTLSDMMPPEQRQAKDPIPAHLRAAVNAKRAQEGRPPLVVEAPSTFSNNGGCSVVDIDGDALAEVLFGLSDGRLYVYRTGMRLEPRHAQWPTLSGSFQHTGTWTRAK